MTGKIIEELIRTKPLVNCSGEFISEILWFKEKTEGKRYKLLWSYTFKGLLKSILFLFPLPGPGPTPECGFLNIGIHTFLGPAVRTARLSLKVHWYNSSWRAVSPCACEVTAGSSKLCLLYQSEICLLDQYRKILKRGVVSLWYLGLPFGAQRHWAARGLTLDATLFLSSEKNNFWYLDFSFPLNNHLTKWSCFQSNSSLSINLIRQPQFSHAITKCSIHTWQVFSLTDLLILRTASVKF